MSQCKAYGRPKQKHPTIVAARIHAHKLNKIQLHLSEPYKCNTCGFWHVGRMPPRKAFRQLLRRQEAIDNALVGKLIQALKNSISYRNLTGHKR